MPFKVSFIPGLDALQACRVSMELRFVAGFDVWRAALPACAFTAIADWIRDGRLAPRIGIAAP
jgi:hypothetical protein